MCVCSNHCDCYVVSVHLFYDYLTANFLNNPMMHNTNEWLWQSLMGHIPRILFLPLIVPFGVTKRGGEGFIDYIGVRRKTVYCISRQNIN